MLTDSPWAWQNTKNHILLPSRLYCRYRNHTYSACARGLYRRSGIAPCPEDYPFVNLYYRLYLRNCQAFKVHAGWLSSALIKKTGRRMQPVFHESRWL